MRLCNKNYERSLNYHQIAILYRARVERVRRTNLEDFSSDCLLFAIFLLSTANFYVIFVCDTQNESVCVQFPSTHCSVVRQLTLKFYSLVEKFFFENLFANNELMSDPKSGSFWVTDRNDLRKFGQKTLNCTLYTSDRVFRLIVNSTCEIRAEGFCISKVHKRSRSDCFLRSKSIRLLYNETRVSDAMCLFIIKIRIYLQNTFINMLIFEYFSCSRSSSHVFKSENWKYSMNFQQFQ